MEITRERALKMIESRPIIDQAMVPYKGIDIAYIGYVNADGDPFTWESGDEYAIVSFNATNEYKFNESVEAFKNEDYEEAVNGRLSLSMPVEQARKLSKGIPGTLICHYVLNNDDIEILVPKSFAPVEAIIAKKPNLSAILAKLDGVKANA